MCVAHFASMWGFSAYPTLLPTLREVWGLSNTQAGLVSGLFFAGYMLAVPILTSLTDRVDARRVYLLSSFVAAAGLIGTGVFARGVLTAGFFQMLAGAGIAGTYMPGLKALSDRLRGASQSRAVSFYTATFGIGLAWSVVMAGMLNDVLGWRLVFVIGAVGPLIAGAMALAVLAPMPRAVRVATRIFDIRPVLRHRLALAFTLGYAVHCFELFGSRSWFVAFLDASRGTLAWPLSPAEIHGSANFIAAFASIIGNEIALRFGRAVWIRTGMLASAIVTGLLGLAFGAPWYVLAALCALHMILVMSDSATLTAGLVATIDPAYRGTAMALYSTLGFGAGFVAPLALGIAIDGGGGEAQGAAWLLAFACLGVVPLTAALLLRFTEPARRAE